MTGRAIACAAMAIAGAALTSGTAQAQTKYRPKGLIKTGYSERQTAPGVWEVKGSSHEDGGAVAVALYRAAELATTQGVSEIRVVKQRIKSITTSTRTGGFVGYSEFAQVTVHAVRDAADRTACDMPDPAKCLTIPVAGILARYGPEMGMPAARPGEAPAAPVRIARTSRLPGLAEDRPDVVGRGYTTPADRYPRWSLAGALLPKTAVVPAPPRYAPSHAPSYAPRGVATVVPAAPPAVRLAATRAAPAPRTAPAAMPEPASYAARLAAAQPVAKRDPKQGWTISD